MEIHMTSTSSVRNFIKDITLSSVCATLPCVTVSYLNNVLSLIPTQRLLNAEATPLIAIHSFASFFVIRKIHQLLDQKLPKDPKDNVSKARRRLFKIYTADFILGLSATAVIGKITSLPPTHAFIITAASLTAYFVLKAASKIFDRFIHRPSKTLKFDPLASNAPSQIVSPSFKQVTPPFETPVHERPSHPENLSTTPPPSAQAILSSQTELPSEPTVATSSNSSTQLVEAHTVPIQETATTSFPTHPLLPEPKKQKISSVATDRPSEVTTKMSTPREQTSKVKDPSSTTQREPSKTSPKVSATSQPARFLSPPPKTQATSQIKTTKPPVKLTNSTPKEKRHIPAPLSPELRTSASIDQPSKKQTLSPTILPKVTFDDSVPSNIQTSPLQSTTISTQKESGHSPVKLAKSDDAQIESLKIVEPELTRTEVLALMKEVSALIKKAHGGLVTLTINESKNAVDLLFASFDKMNACFDALRAKKKKHFPKLNFIASMNSQGDMLAECFHLEGPQKGKPSDILKALKNSFSS